MRCGEVVARVLEHGARGSQFGEHRLGRRSAAGLRDVDQPAVALDDAQGLERERALEANAAMAAPKVARSYRDFQ